jgi:dephospho-CoA kinase
MKIIGLTGSIGMGKSATAALFAEEGAAVWDADAAVHRLYGPGQPGAAAVALLAPGAVGPQGVDRRALKAAILADPGLLARVEAAVHPLVTADRAAFLAAARDEGRAVAVCDVPLLYETGAQGEFDAVAVVSAPPEIQRQRVLERPGMTAEAFEAILAWQMPDADKRAKADVVIDSSRGLETARAQVRAFLARLKGQ